MFSLYVSSKMTSASSKVQHGRAQWEVVRTTHHLWVANFRENLQEMKSVCTHELKYAQLRVALTMQYGQF